MSRRQLLTTNEREALLAFPTDEAELIRLTSFSEQDIALINQHRGEANKLGFAIQLCYLRYPSQILEEGSEPNVTLLKRVSKILKISLNQWGEYAGRAQTRWAHLQELYTYLQVHPYSTEHHQNVISYLTELATQTDKGMVVAEAMVANLRQKHIIVPALSVIERACTKALAQGVRQVYTMLSEAVSTSHCRNLDRLLKIREGSKQTAITWLRQPPGKCNAKHILLHIDRLKMIQELNLPEGIDKLIHQNRLLKLAREGSQMTSKDLSKFEPSRRYASVVMPH